MTNDYLCFLGSGPHLKTVLHRVKTQEAQEIMARFASRPKTAERVIAILQ